MDTHRLALLGGALLCAHLLAAESLAAQTPATSSMDTSAGRADTPIEAVQTPDPDIDPGEAPAARRVLQDEANHRDRVARVARLREILSQRGDRVRLARLDDIERREVDRHDAHQRRERERLSERTVRGLDEVVRRGGTFRASARDIAVARQRAFGVDRERAQRDPTRRDESADVAPEPDIDVAEAPAARRVLQDEANHRDRVARAARLREILSQRGDRVRLARLDDIERRELERHDAHQRRERERLSDRTVRGVDDVVRRGGTFRASARDIAVARQRAFGVDRDGGQRDARPARASPGSTHSTPSSRPVRRTTTHDSRSPR